MFAAVFWDSLISFIEASVPGGWSFTVRHVLRAGTLSVIIYRLLLYLQFFRNTFSVNIKQISIFPVHF